MILALDFQSSVIFIFSFSLFQFSFKDPVNKSLFILTIVKMSFAFLSQQIVLYLLRRGRKSFNFPLEIRDVLLLILGPAVREGERQREPTLDL